MKLLGYALLAFGGWITLRLVQTKFGTDVSTTTPGQGNVSVGIIYTGVAAGALWFGWKLVKRG